MAIHPAPVSVEAQRPSLTLVVNRKTDRRSAADEAHVELLAFLDEAEAAALLIVDAIAGLPVPSLRAINEAGRIAFRAAKARAEYWSLVGPEDAA